MRLVPVKAGAAAALGHHASGNGVNKASFARDPEHLSQRLLAVGDAVGCGKATHQLVGVATNRDGASRSAHVADAGVPIARSDLLDHIEPMHAAGAEPHEGGT